MKYSRVWLPACVAVLMLAFAAPSQAADLRWSRASTWPTGRVPAAGEDVTIPANTTVILDVTPPALGGLTINGKLAFAAKNVQLSAKWIMLHGTLQVGTE